MKDDEKNALIEHRIARATDTIEEGGIIGDVLNF